MPPSAVYSPVSTITSTEPIQKLSIVDAAEVKLHLGQQRAEHHAAREDADRDLRDRRT